MAAASAVMTIQVPIFFVRVQQRLVSGLGGGKGLKDGWT
jgi:ABC-type maltose transport system permease subunit